MNNSNNLLETSFYNTVGQELFNKTILQFKEKARTVGLTSQEHILYNIVRNLPINRGFSPATNKIKLANGYAPDSKLKFAKSNILFIAQYNFKVLAEQYGWNDQVKFLLIDVLSNKK